MYQKKLKEIKKNYNKQHSRNQKKQTTKQDS